MTALNKGILFEESNEFLKWGEPLREISKRLGIYGHNKSGRTLFEWGKRTILGGLEVELTSTFRNFTFFPWNRKFNEVNSWTIGDKHAEKEYERISTHLVSKYGEPSTSKTPPLPDDQILEWELDKFTISLVLFDQHCYKLLLTIKERE